MFKENWGKTIETLSYAIAKYNSEIDAMLVSALGDDANNKAML